LNFMFLKGRHKVPFQKGSLADMRIHHWIKEAVLCPIVSGARQCNMRASKELIYSYLAPPSLSYSHVCADTDMFYTDLHRLLYILDK